MDDDTRGQIRQYLVARRADQFRFLADIVRIPSENPPGDCQPHALKTADLLKAIGLATYKHPVPVGVCRDRGMQSVVNLVARYEFGPGPTVALQAYGDTAPAGGGWSGDPFAASVAKGVMSGRGVAAAKGSLAAYAFAALALRSLNTPLAGAVELHITYDHETGGELGVPWLLEKGIANPDYAICAGGAYGIIATHNGALLLEVRIQGRTGYAAVGDPGADAIEAADRVLQTLYAMRGEYAGVRPTIRGLAPPTLTVGTIQGGSHPDRICDEVALGVSRRLMPDEDVDLAEKELTARITETVMGMSGIVCRIRRTGMIAPLKPIRGTEKLIRVLSKNGHDIMGERVMSQGQPTPSDARHYAAVGIPAVLYGAGPKSLKAANAYRADEQLPLDDLRKATEVLAFALGEFMSPP